MPETISEDEYWGEVQNNAERLAEYAREDVEAGEHETVHAATIVSVSDVLDAHEWFSRSHYGPVAHGAIIEHSEANPEEYSDWMALSEADDPATAVKRMAYCAFEADVIEKAREMADD